MKIVAGIPIQHGPADCYQKNGPEPVSQLFPYLVKDGMDGQRPHRVYVDTFSSME